MSKIELIDECVITKNDVRMKKKEKDIMEKNCIDINGLITGTDIKIARVTRNLNVEQARSIPDGTVGVYVIYVDSGKAYIGKSEGDVGIKQRIFSHTREGWHKNIIKSIDIYETETLYHAYELEKIMIAKLQPELNTRYYTVDHLEDKNITNVGDESDVGIKNDIYENDNQIFMLLNSIIRDDKERKIIGMIIENKEPGYILDNLIIEEK